MAARYNKVSRLLWSAGKERAEVELATIKDVLATVTGLLDYRLKNAGIVFQVKIDEGLKVGMSPYDLQEILLNVFVNSIQAMPNGGMLSLTARKEDEKVHMQITDTGHGINQDDLEQIFEMFFTTKEAGKGTGLGLWMTHEVIKKYKGDISIKSEKGIGTSLSIVLPAESQ